MARRMMGTTVHESGPRVVAMGGGHGLAVSLRALTKVTHWVTAVVGVADDGGSSGRLRKEFGVLPPGDLRMALAALCGDDAWGRTWSRVIQHRFAGSGELCGHSLGNLLITSLWEDTSDVVSGLDLVGSLLEAQGRVLPVALAPLEFIAEVEWPDAGTQREVRGQVAVASTTGRVLSVRVEPADPPVCPEAKEAITEADHIIFGPGSWYTSVTAPMLVPDLRAAVAQSQAERSLVLNLCPQPGETSDFEPHTHLEVWQRDLPEIGLHRIIADPDLVTDVPALEKAAAELGAEVMLLPLVAVGTDPPAHNPDLLAAAFSDVLGHGRITPWQ